MSQGAPEVHEDVARAVSDRLDEVLQTRMPILGTDDAMAPRAHSGSARSVDTSRDLHTRVDVRFSLRRSDDGEGVPAASPESARLIAQRTADSIARALSEWLPARGYPRPLRDVLLWEATQARVRAAFELGCAHLHAPRHRPTHWPPCACQEHALVLIEVEHTGPAQVLSVPIGAARRAGPPIDRTTMLQWQSIEPGGLLMIPRDYRAQDDTEGPRRLGRAHSLESPRIELQRRALSRHLAHERKFLDFAPHGVVSAASRLQVRLFTHTRQIGARTQATTIARVVRADWMLGAYSTLGPQLPTAIVQISLEERGPRTEANSLGRVAQPARDEAEVLSLTGLWFNGLPFVGEHAAEYCRRCFRSPRMRLPDGERALWFDLRPKDDAWQPEQVLQWIDELLAQDNATLLATLTCMTCDADGVVREYACNIDLEVHDGPCVHNARHENTTPMVSIVDLAHSVNAWPEDESRLWRAGNAVRLQAYQLPEAPAED